MFSFLLVSQISIYQCCKKGKIKVQSSQSTLLWGSHHQWPSVGEFTVACFVTQGKSMRQKLCTQTKSVVPLEWLIWNWSLVFYRGVKSQGCKALERSSGWAWISSNMVRICGSPGFPRMLPVSETSLLCKGVHMIWHQWHCLIHTQ